MVELADRRGLSGWVPLRALIIFGAIAAATLVLNQIRTLVASVGK